MTTAPFLKAAATNIVELLLQEFVQEAAITRRVLERIPLARLNWKPHAKSMSLGALALHVASSPAAVAGWIAADAVDLPNTPTRPEPASLDSILIAHEQSVQAVKRALESVRETGLQGKCVLRKNGATFMTMPKLAIVRTLVLNHLIHHRGQLSLCLRLLDVPVPSIYGPSADEAPFARL